MAKTLMGDVGNGKGSRKRLGADDKAYADGWQRIFGNKNKDENKSESEDKKESEEKE